MRFDTCTDSPNRPVWPQPSEENGVEHMLQEVTGLPSQGEDFPPLFSQQGGKGTQREGLGKRTD